MKTIKRRDVLKTAAVIAAGGAAGSALPAQARGPLQPFAKTGHLREGAIWLKVNGQAKQNANLSQMIWNVAEQVSNLSKAFELMPGDIIYGGAPGNVGPVVRGDIMDAHIDGLPDIRVRVV